MRIPMIVKKAFRPGGSNSLEVQPGSRFMASGESQARVFRALGWVEDAPLEASINAVEPPKRTYTRKVVEPEAPAPVAVKQTTRSYFRRDLTAEPPTQD